MFGNKKSSASVFSSDVIPAMFERLEDRRLLSGSHGIHSHGLHGIAGNTIEFSQAPAAVQAGLDTLVTNAGLTAPAADSTQTVFLANRNGVETYKIDVTGTGTDTWLTVDASGAAYTKPTTTTTTWGTLNGADTGSNSAAATEIAAIATALGLTRADRYDERESGDGFGWIGAVYGAIEQRDQWDARANDQRGFQRESGGGCNAAVQRVAGRDSDGIE